MTMMMMTMRMMMLVMMMMMMMNDDCNRKDDDDDADYQTWPFKDTSNQICFSITGIQSWLSRPEQYSS